MILDLNSIRGLIADLNAAKEDLQPIAEQYEDVWFTLQNAINTLEALMGEQP